MATLREQLSALDASIRADILKVRGLIASGTDAQRDKLQSALVRLLDERDDLLALRLDFSAQELNAATTPVAAALLDLRRNAVKRIMEGLGLFGAGGVFGAGSGGESGDGGGAGEVVDGGSVSGPDTSTGVVTEPEVVVPVPVPAVPAEGVVPPDHNHKSRDLDFLHPDVRRRVKAVQKKLDEENIPMKVFEAYRTPERQAWLFAQGRTRPGKKITWVNSWGSYHQYGMAADFVRFENGSWNWNNSTSEQKAQWKRFHDIARSQGLEPLTRELPHVQKIGTSSTQLMNGDYPEGGDDSWSGNLAAVIQRWSGAKKPPIPVAGERPPGPPIAISNEIGPSDWHNMFGGDHWRHDSSGVFTRNHDGTLKLWRTLGAPSTVLEIISRYGEVIEEASSRFKVPATIIIMTIATETAKWRLEGFTGPKTFRWEQDVTLQMTGDENIDGKEKGDYSAGPMQTLSNTARWMNDKFDLGFDPAVTLKFFKNRPSKNPESLGLYDARVSIFCGAAYLAHNQNVTGNDPLLAAACYNAGSLKPSPENHWRIRSAGNHLDRAAEWFGDACAVLNGSE